MKLASLYNKVEYNKSKPLINVLFETNFTKEIRIVMHQDTVMKKHKTSFPIVIQIVEGAINFGLHEKTHILKKGDLIALAEGEPHNLHAIENSIIRLTLTKYDESNRVKDLINQTQFADF